AIAGGDLPEVIKLSGAATIEIAVANGANGHVVALDTWDPQIGTYDWVKPVQRAMTRGGKLYSMPVNSGAVAFYYNKDLYKAAGLDPEKPPDTMDQLMELAGKLTKPAEQIWGHYGLTAPTAQSSTYFNTLLFVFGGKDVSDDG